MINWARISIMGQQGPHLHIALSFCKPTRVIPWWHLSLTAILMFHGCGCRLNWVSFELLPGHHSLHQAQLISYLWHIVPIIWMLLAIFTCSQGCSSALPDSGASYPFGPIVDVLHQSGWWTASYSFALNITPSSSFDKYPWDYPETDINCRQYSVDKRSPDPCLAPPPLFWGGGCKSLCVPSRWLLKAARTLYWYCFCYCRHPYPASWLCQSVSLLPHCKIPFCRDVTPIITFVPT